MQFFNLTHFFMQFGLCSFFAQISINFEVTKVEFNRKESILNRHRLVGPGGQIRFGDGIAGAIYSLIPEIANITLVSANNIIYLVFALT